MSDSGITDDDCFKSDMMNSLSKKSSTQSPSIDSPPSIGKGSNGNLVKGGLLSDAVGSGTSSPLLDTVPLPAEDLSICPYCNKNYRKPRVLDCLHSLCEDCIIAQLDGRVDNKKENTVASITDCELEQSANQMRPTPPGVIRCPICYQESHVGNDVRFVNFMLLDFIRLREADSLPADKGDRICRACKGSQPAVANCRHCCSDICKNCVQAHRDMKMFDGHKVVLFSEGDAEPQSNGTTATVDMALCAHHQLQYEYICTNCDELICQQCYPEHKSHTCSHLNEEIGQFYTAKLKALIEQVENRGRATSDARSLIPDRLNDLNSAYERCKAKIDAAFEFYAKILGETKQKVFEDLEHKKDEQEDHFNNLYQKIDLQTARLQDAVSFTSRLIEKGTVVELCASRKKVWQQLQNLLHGMPERELTADIDMDFTIPKEQEFKAKFEHLVGTVDCRVVSAPVKDEKLLASVLTAAPNGTTGEQIYSLNRVPSSASGWDGAHITRSFAQMNFNNSQEQVRLPGAIGMERRQTRGSVASNMTALADPMFNAQPLVPSPPNPMAANNDIFGIAQTPVSMMNNVQNRGGMGSSFNPITPTSINFSKVDPMNWTNTYQNPSSQFDMTRQLSRDPRYAGQPDFGLANFDIFSSNRSSQCTTPSFDAPFANPNMLDNKNMGFMGLGGIPRMPNTIEMSIHTTFGSSTGGIDMISTPQGICLGLDDEIIVADTNNHRCVVFNTSGKYLRQFGTGAGMEDGALYYPRKIVSIISGRDCRFIVLDRGNGPNGGTPNRFSMYNAEGEFMTRLHPIPAATNDQINTFAWHKDTAHLITVDCKSNVCVFDVSDIPIIKPVSVFSVSTHVQEASDVAIYKNHYFITDYKTHSIVVYNIEGKFIHKFGNINTTPFPIGIDISKSGDVLIGDSHGNNYHITVFNALNQFKSPLQDYKCTSMKVSRCTGLKITTEGYIVTMSRQTNTVLVFNTLFMPPLPQMM